MLQKCLRLWLSYSYLLHNIIILIHIFDKIGLHVAPLTENKRIEKKRAKRENKAPVALGIRGTNMTTD